MDFPVGSEGKAPHYNAGDLGSISGLGRCPEEGNGNPLQCSCQLIPTIKTDKLLVDGKIQGQANERDKMHPKFQRGE